MTQENELNSHSDRYSDGLDFGSRMVEGSSRMAEPGYEDYLPTGSPRSGARKVVGIGTAKDRLSERFNAAADYVTSRDMSDMVDDVKEAARKHPRVAIVALAAVGFLIGRSLRRSR